MFLWLGTSTQTRRVKGGRSERAYCPECDRERRFVEVEIRDAINLFSVIPLFDDAERAFRCSECDLVGQLGAAGDRSAATAGSVDHLSPEAQERIRRAQEAERAERAAAERLRRERLQRKREANAEIELAELKARMGMGNPEADRVEEPSPAEMGNGDTARRRWWKIWQRG